MKKSFIVLVFILPFLIQSENPKEFSQWRGPERSGIYSETGLLTEWPEEGPELLWSVEELAPGYSSVSIANNTIYLTGIRKSEDILIALDLKGNKKWETVYGKSWNSSFPESRSTPTVENDKLYVTSGLGDFACINAINGEIIWKVEASKKFEGSYGGWGITESPLIVDDKVIFTPCGNKTTMIALNKNTGETIWQTESLNDNPGYASPILAMINNTKVIINVLANNLIGINADNGNILFHKDYASISNEVSVAFWDGGPFTNTNNPVYKDYNIYLTSGYDHVGVMFELSKDLSKVEIKWIDTKLDVHHGGTVLVDDYIYGANWVTNRDGNWCCIDWETGQTKYETKWETKGSIIYADGKLYCYEERKGNIALVNPTPESFDIISSFKIPLGKGPHWSHPVIKDGVLYIRHMDALMAYNIKKL
ncbi:PQQ-binding-like beta-propeller repeat protein [Bacteroidota bacterium]